MMCLRCGNEIKDNEQICSKCGYNKNSSPNNDNKFATNNIGVLNTNPIDKEESERRLTIQKQFDELVEIYIGSMYYNFKKGSFSWCAFFFGPLYFLYRKLYAVGIFIIILNGIISTIFRNNYLLLSIVQLVFAIFQGVVFKKLYFNECVERIAKIKQKNEDKGFNQLTEIVRLKGGVNKLVLVIAVLFYLIVFISMLILILSILQASGVI